MQKRDRSTPSAAARLAAISLFLLPLLIPRSGQAMTPNNAPAATQPSSTIWNLDDPRSVAGHSTEILGSPRRADSPVGPSLQFNGKTDGLLVNANPLDGWPQFTIEMLIKPTPDGDNAQRYLHLEDASGRRALLELRLANGRWVLDAFLFNAKTGLVLMDPAKSHPANQWTWVAMIFQNNKLNSYVNGVPQTSGDIDFSPMGPGKTSLGVRQTKISWFKGNLRQVRFAPLALTPDKLQRPPQP
jgi:hypothetical protein